MVNIINQKATYLIIIIMLLTFSCATTYNRGSNSSEIAHNYYNVEFDGNSSNTVEQIVKFAYLKAAETALDNGYMFFYILDTENGIDEYEIKEEQIAEIDPDLLIGCSAVDTIDYSLPEKMLEYEENNLEIKIILVNKRLGNTYYPFNASLVVEECIPLTKYVKRRKIARNISISVVSTGAVIGLGFLINAMVIIAGEDDLYY